MTPCGMPLLADAASVSARVSTPAEADQAARFSQASRSASRASWLDGSVTARKIAPRAPAVGREVHRLDVLGVGPDIADVRKGEGDDLAA